MQQNEKSEVRGVQRVKKSLFLSLNMQIADVAVVVAIVSLRKVPNMLNDRQSLKFTMF